MESSFSYIYSYIQLEYIHFFNLKSFDLMNPEEMQTQ